MDVLIVGAGLAGIAAARRSLEHGSSVLLLESAPIAGGRAHLGPLWLHCADRNPLTPIAGALGFEVAPAIGPELCFGLGDPVEAGRRSKERIDEIEAKIEASPDDRPLSELLLHRDRYDELAERTIAPLSMGLDSDRISIADYRTLVPERGDAMVREGLDRLVLALADGLPILFEAPVERIEWSRDSARAITPKGTFEAKRAIVTASIGALGSIAFDPPLPDHVAQAFDSLEMSIFEKVYLEVDLEVASNTRACDARDPHGFEWFLRPLGRPQAIAMIGGRRALELSDPIAAAARALERMLEQRIVPRSAVATRFHLEPRFGGSWSVAKPNRSDARRKNPTCGALTFAGEAFDPEWGTTLAGAWSSGMRAV